MSAFPTISYPLPVVTLTAPWSWLVAGRLKRNETRSWARSYRGVLGIHSGLGLGPVGGPEGLLALCQTEPFARALAQLGISDPLAEPRGCIIAVANLTGIRPTTEVAAEIAGTDELAFGNYDAGRFAWRLDGAVKLRTPIKAAGRLGLWYYTPPATAAEGAIACM